MDYKETKKEIKELVESGIKLYESIETDGKTNKSKDLSYFVSNYEYWYSKAYVVVKQLLPDRLQDFISQYKNEKRKELKFATYTITDALRTLTRPGVFGPDAASYCMLNQVQILKSCLDVFDSRIHDLQTLLQADIFDSEIDSAKHLLKMGYYRAAGAICGVVLEKHFAGVCAKRSVTLKKKSPTIADYNDALKDNAYDTIEWRRIQRLGDIRNLCDHSKDREPTKEEVEELISGTERTIKTVF